MSTLDSHLPIGRSEPFAYRADELPLEGRYVRASSSERARGGVVIAPDWRGLSPHVLQEAQRIAKQGYDVVVADLHGHGRFAEDETEAKGLLKNLLDHRALTTARMQACVATFSQRLPDGARIAALGFSIGGMALLDLGRAQAAVAGIAISSALLKTAESGTATKIACPLLVLQGSLDVVCPTDVVASLVKELDQANSRFRVVLFGGAHHAYYNPAAGTDPTARLCYSAETEALANAEVDRFLRDVLTLG